MNAGKLESVQDIVTNLEAVKGEAFVRTVLLAVKGKSLIGMISAADMRDDQREAISNSAKSLLAALVSEIIAARGFDPVEVTKWAGRLEERLY